MTRTVGPKRILIVNPFGIGDVLFTTPLIRAVRQAFPKSYLGYVCNQRTEHILRENPLVDELFVYEKDELVAAWHASPWQGLRYVSVLLKKISQRRFELVIDLSLGERYSFLLGLVGVRRRVGFDFRHRGRFLTERLPIAGYSGVHVVEYYRRLLQFMGVILVDGSLELPVSAEDAAWAKQWIHEHRMGNRRPLVGLVPAGGVSWGIDASFRRWGIEGFAAVGDALAQRYGAQVMLFGESADRAVCQTVVRLMQYPAIDLCGQTTLGQFVSLMGHLDLIVCNDGGPLHLAVSQRVRTVSIFGPVDPAVYGPYDQERERHRVVCRENLPCRPCYHHFRLPPCPYERACLTAIPAEEVIEACAAVLNSDLANRSRSHHANV